MIDGAWEFRENSWKLSAMTPVWPLQQSKYRVGQGVDMNSYMELQDVDSDSACNCIFIVKATWKLRLSERVA